MSDAIFPLSFATEELRLLTAIGLGFLFGFSLERAGFGNARKLAAQFYLRDMTVFKVMFTAILVAMVGLYALTGLGLVDTSMLWINPTFMWAQVVGGFVLGVGFILSGLCPGTSVVSAASGRWDAVATFAGIFVGVAVFVVAVDVLPPLEALYSAGDM
ncbi:MAG: YeeE/YedE thiosulfate transporter family protein, partial [Gemmatimonadota bacterium]